MFDRIRIGRLAIAALWAIAVLDAPAQSAPAQGAAAATAEAEAASATLPLDEILKLYRERDEAARDQPAAPPVPASLQKVELTGRLLNDGIDFQGRFEVSVLSQDEWVAVPLLALDADSHLSKLPTVKAGSFAVQNGKLVFLTEKRGRYTFDLSLFRAAKAEGRARVLRLAHGGAALATCKLEIDGGLFQLRAPQATETPGGVQIFAQGDAFEIEWEVLEELEPSRDEVAPPVAIESVVPRVHASTVSTLEGRRITRVLYDLRFAGRKPVSIQLPAGQKLERAFLNGVAIPAEPEGRSLSLTLAPARAGDEGGSLELVLSHATGVFHLAGDLHFELPRISWPTHELFFTLHLPTVFDYDWTGGSLEPSSKTPRAPYRYQVPQPGRALHFHQYLISESAPDLALSYTVNLDGHYFTDSRREAATELQHQAELGAARP